ncbi:MAG: glucosamine-6-phosphate isomerase [Candidatus Sumerlaeota bacterium]|nr:glucosamine-6-phosphate isomerase [Candidatus Sumerlaeota bacterium]
MSRPLSVVAPDWWDYTTLDRKILEAAANLTPDQMLKLSRPGFEVRFYDSLQSFYLAEALEYIETWEQATPEQPAGICGPIGPTEQLPLVAQLVNAQGLDLRHAHFWGMDEWYFNGREVPVSFPLSFEKADRELCFNRIHKKLVMPESNLHFPKAATLKDYTKSYDKVRCVVMQGGQGEVKHWAFNDPPRRTGKHKDQPPAPEEIRKLTARVVDLHPMTVIQNARTSGGGRVYMVPTQALSVGPGETFKADRVSIWHPGHHDNAFGMRLTTYMISKKIVDAAVPMSLLGLHPHVRFSFYRGGIGSCEVEMH